MEKKKFATEEMAKCGDKSEVTGVTELYDDALNDVRLCPKKAYIQIQAH